MDDKSIALVVMSIICLLFILSLLLVFVLIIPAWMRGLLGGVRVSILEVVGMRVRGNPAGLLIDTMLALEHRGIKARSHDVESAYIANKGMHFTPTELADLVADRLLNKK